ncbi:MAG: hypothetical protein ACLP5V_04535 [Candidatus Bathyarchaeia archaeon]
MRSTPDYVPAIIFLLASGLLLPFLFLVAKTGSGAAAQVSVLIMLAIIASLICGVVIREVRFYAYVTAMIGIALRAASVMFSPISSDVLAISAKGATLLLSGRNPYAVLGEFAYPPLEPLFYIPFIGFDLRWVEFASGSVIVLILLVTSLRSKNQSVSVLYLALYCFSTLMIGFVGASTNDTSAALFPFLGIWLIMFSSYKHKYDYAGLLMGLGMVFKQFGIFPLIFVIGFLIKCKGPWLRTTIVTSLTTAAISLPFLLWNPTEFLFDVVTFHLAVRIASPYYVIGALNPVFMGPSLLVLQISLMAVLSVFLLYRIRNWAECQLAWTSIFLLSLVLGRYFAPSYFAYIMPFWILAGMSSLADRISPLTAAQKLKGTRVGLTARHSFIA